MHSLAPSPPAVDDLVAPRLVLRDRPVASVRRSTPGDREAMRRFFRSVTLVAVRQAGDDRRLIAVGSYIGRAGSR